MQTAAAVKSLTKEERTIYLLFASRNLTNHEVRLIYKACAIRAVGATPIYLMMFPNDYYSVLAYCKVLVLRHAGLVDIYWCMIEIINRSAKKLQFICTRCSFLTAYRRMVLFTFIAVSLLTIVFIIAVHVYRDTCAFPLAVPVYSP